jgi:hypothetical protein
MLSARIIPPPEFVGEPRPEIKPDDADEQCNLDAAAAGAEIDRKFFDQKRRDQGQNGPSIPSKPQPSSLAQAICQCVEVIRVLSAAFR